MKFSYWIALVIALPFMAGWRTGAMELKKEAVVTGKYVSVLDLVRSDGLSDDLRQELKKVYVGRSPAVGETRTISAVEISAELVRRGFRPEQAALSGTAVMVRRSVADPAFELLHGRMADFLYTTLHLGRKHKRLTIVEVNGGEPLPSADLTPLELAVAPPLQAGVHTCRMRLKSRSDRECVIEISVRIVDLVTAVRAARAIPMGKILWSEDVETTTLETTQPDTVLTDLDLVLGSRMVKPVKKGDLLSRESVRLKPIVRRRDVVRARDPFIAIDARALQDGGVGDIIDLEYVGTRNKFKGKVIGSGVVEIME